jgi:beta-lactamase regulating signal transducer with metallopeptidase domain
MAALYEIINTLIYFLEYGMLYLLTASALLIIGALGIWLAEKFIKLRNPQVRMMLWLFLMLVFYGIAWLRMSIINLHGQAMISIPVPARFQDKVSWMSKPKLPAAVIVVPPAGKPDNSAGRITKTKPRIEPRFDKYQYAPELKPADFFMLAWLVIFFIMLLRLGMGFLAANRLVAESEPAPQAVEALLMTLDQDLRNKMTATIRQIKRNLFLVNPEQSTFWTNQIRLRLSENVSSPVVVGWLRSTILLPKTWAETLEEEKLRVLLTHELAHARNNHYFSHFWYRLLHAAFFFNPAMWLLGRQFKFAMEEVCDIHAVGVAASASSYASFLLWVAEQQPAQKATLTLGVAEEPSNLRRRVERILQGKFDLTQEQRVGANLVWGLVILLVLFIFVGFDTRPVQSRKPAPLPSWQFALKSAPPTTIFPPPTLRPVEQLPEPDHGLVGLSHDNDLVLTLQERLNPLKQETAYRIIDDKRLQAYDYRTGASKWEVALARKPKQSLFGYRKAGARVVAIVSEEDNGTTNEMLRMIVLEAATGRRLWSYDLGKIFDFYPRANGKEIIVLSEEWGRDEPIAFRFLSARTGKELLDMRATRWENGELLNHYATVREDKVDRWFICDDARQTVFGFDLSQPTGKPVWVRKFAGSVEHVYTKADRIIVVSQKEDPYHLISHLPAYVTSLYPATGEVDWQGQDWSGELDEAMLTTDRRGTIVPGRESIDIKPRQGMISRFTSGFSSSNTEMSNNVYRYDKGELRWRTVLDSGKQWFSPLLGVGSVSRFIPYYQQADFGMTTNSRLFLIDADTGQVAGRFETKPDSEIVEVVFHEDKLAVAIQSPWATGPVKIYITPMQELVKSTKGSPSDSVAKPKI